MTRERREEVDLETGKRRSWVESKEFEVLDLTGEETVFFAEISTYLQSCLVLRRFTSLPAEAEEAPAGGGQTRFF